MTRNALALVAAIMFAPDALAAQALPAFGLRMDAQSSMQWSADTLMLHGRAAQFMVLPVDSILDVWPGPARGAFAVVSRQGLGMLLGPTIGPSAHPFGTRALLRSSRPELVVACVGVPDGSPCRRFIEWRSGNRQRELLTLPAEVADFDIDVAGRIVALTRAGKVVVADGRTVREVPFTGGPPPGSRFHRVFVDDRGGEIALLADRALFRFLTARGTWSSVPVDPRADAIVRHAASRRVRVEARFRPGATPAP